MKEQDDLFLLIKSLSNSEKGYFKKFISNEKLYKGNQVYLKLFNTIEQQKSYDEKLIKKIFAGEKFIVVTHPVKERR